MTDRSEEIEELFFNTGKLGTYLSDLSAEQNRLQGDVVAGDLIEITRRLAQINAELAVGHTLYKAAQSAHQELKRRERFYTRVQEKQTSRIMGPQKTL